MEKILENVYLRKSGTSKDILDEDPSLVQTTEILPYMIINTYCLRIY